MSEYDSSQNYPDCCPQLNCPDQDEIVLQDWVDHQNFEQLFPKNQFFLKMLGIKDTVLTISYSRRLDHLVALVYPSGSFEILYNVSHNFNNIKMPDNNLRFSSFRILLTKYCFFHPVFKYSSITMLVKYFGPRTNRIFWLFSQGFRKFYKSNNVQEIFKTSFLDVRVGIQQ